MTTPPSSDSSSSSVAHIIPIDAPAVTLLSHYRLPCPTTQPPQPSTPERSTPPVRFEDLPLHRVLFPPRPGCRSHLTRNRISILETLINHQAPLSPFLCHALATFLSEQNIRLPHALRLQYNNLRTDAGNHPTAAATAFSSNLRLFLTQWTPPVHPHHPDRPTTGQQRRPKRRRSPTRLTQPTRRLRPRPSAAVEPTLLPVSTPNFFRRTVTSLRHAASRVARLFSPTTPPITTTRRGRLN